MTLLAADRGLAPRALRDMAVAGGALLGLGNPLRNQPDRDDAEAADTVTEDVLRLFGLPADEAREICRRPLPDLNEVTLPDSAA